MKKNLVPFILLAILIVLACTLPGQLASPNAKIPDGSDFVLVAPPGSTPTPTPFQPLPPTPIYNPTDSPVGGEVSNPEITPVPVEKPAWGDYAGPSIWPDIDIPEPVGILPHPDGQVNILLLGSDQRPYDGGFRTDTIQLVTVNPSEGTVKMTAFPRDLYVYIPGYTVQRINTAFQWGGFDALATTMEYNFGVRPEYYAMINFWSFKEVIDSLGGVTVNIGRDLCDHRAGYGEYCVGQGPRVMDGETALWYVRSRYSTSDLDRGRRQQEVLRAIFDKMVSLDGLNRAPELYDIYQQNVTTNLSFEFLSRFLPLALSISRNGQIDQYRIGEDQVYSWTTTTGAMVLVPVREPVLEVMQQVISNP